MSHTFNPFRNFGFNCANNSVKELERGVLSENSCIVAGVQSVGCLLLQNVRYTAKIDMKLA
jgi:hypothetical protein